MKNSVQICCICGKHFEGWGNNPYPVNNHPDCRCCDDCNYEYVIPARLELIYSKRRVKDE